MPKKLEAANDNIDPRLMKALAKPEVARSVIHGTVWAPTTAEEKRQRAAIVKAKNAADEKIMKAYREVFAAREARSDGWDGKSVGGVSLPAIKWLLANGKHHLLPPVLAYRRLDAATYSTELTGRTAMTEELLQLDHYTWFDEGTGELKYGSERRMTGIDFTGREPHGKSSVDPMQIKPQPAGVPKKWNGDAGIIARIDAIPRIWRLRTKLGPLAERFEDLVLHGRTLGDVGRPYAGHDQTAMAVGAAILTMGIDVVRVELGDMREEEFREILLAA